MLIDSSLGSAVKIRNDVEHLQDLSHNSEFLSREEFLNDLSYRFLIPEENIREIEKVVAIYPMKISRYYWSLVKDRNDPLWNQCVPNIKEIQNQVGEEDPLAEERDSPAPLITHRYPDRLLLLISDTCDMYCRFCTRKRKIGTEKLTITREKINIALEYIRTHTEIRDVILSGGDALCTPHSMLEYILSQLRLIPHVEIIRIGTRLPCTNPHKITTSLCEILSRYHPIYMNVHFEHPDELTEEAITACNMLADAGIPLGNQNVLLKGVNDKPEVMGELYKKLLRARVRPYYLFQADYVKGTNHFRTSVETGLNIIRGIRGFISGLAIPHYVIDSPGGGGKIPILPDYLQSLNEKEAILTNYQGLTFRYPQSLGD